MLNKTLVAALAAAMLGSVGTSFAATRTSDVTPASPAVSTPKVHKAVKKHKVAKAHKAVAHKTHKVIHRPVAAKATTHKVAMHEPASVQSREARMQEARAKWEKSRKL